jgi:enoyl-CoA hydratase
MTNPPELYVHRMGAVGHLTLNRPAALGALTLGMVRQMTLALQEWRSDDAVEVILIDHAGDRGFCAGGDIRALYDSVNGDGEMALAFFREEYQLDHLLFEYPKPTCVIMDGVVMGGGSGIALPCRHRIATERTAFAMPETGIGLFPDVGGGWYLPRLPGKAGLWLALTGSRLRAPDCMHLGLATTYVPADQLQQLKANIIATPGDLVRILADHAADPGPPPYAALADQIDRTFDADRLEDIITNLAAEGSTWAQTIAARSPTLLKVALRQLHDGALMPDFASHMAMEFRIASRVIMAPDFNEGVRAVIIDKDGAPRWNPATLDAVTPAMIEAIFAPLPDDLEWKPLDP